jgi:hypothetical protein
LLRSLAGSHARLEVLWLSLNAEHQSDVLHRRAGSTLSEIVEFGN